MPEERFEIHGSSDDVLELVAEAAEIWGGEWQRAGTGGRLALPVSAGIRHGQMMGQVSTRSRGQLCEVMLKVEKTHYQLHWPSLVVLLIGAIGGLLLIATPFYPPLVGLAPVGIIVSLAAWFLVASRVRTRSSRDFFRLVGELGGEEARRSRNGTASVVQ